MTYLAIGLCFILAIFIIRLITKHKRDALAWQAKEQALIAKTKSADQQHHRETRRLLDALSHPFFSISQEGKIIRYNNQAADIFRDRNLDGRSIRQIFLEAEIITIIEETFQSSTHLTRTLTLSPSSPFSSNKAPSHWAIETHPVSLRSDQFEIQLIMRDISSSVLSDQVRQDFVANASHELRTPLSIISGYLENLTEEDALDQKPIAEKMLTTMSRHVDRINQIVEDMLVISKLETKEPGQLKIQNFPISQCVNDIIERLDPLITAQNATITTNLSDITINGDLFYWTQLLFNLIENALKQNPDTPLEIKIAATQSQHLTTISVTDTGIGIPRDDLAFIFKRFYRVEKHHSQNNIKGTGLGLSIVKRAVEAHGGTISVTSTPGTETTFTIELPEKTVSKVTH